MPKFWGWDKKQCKEERPGYGGEKGRGSTGLHQL